VGPEEGVVGAPFEPAFREARELARERWAASRPSQGGTA
jgi:hypothetical protein